MSLYDSGQKFHEKCEEFLAQIDRLDGEIAAAAADKKRIQKLQRDKADLHRKFAAHLYDSAFDLVDPSGYFIDFSYHVGDRFLRPYWLVEGVPSKNRREEARAWMAARGVEWDGSAPSLRGEVSKALTRNEPVPDRKFGLHVERAVKIDATEWLKNETGTDSIPVRRR
jgi:hypothetical protein